jgi:site-specific DNA-cytosine methylase
VIKYRHIKELGPVDLVICGFPCQGFSRASRKAQGLRDPRSAVFFDMVNIIHEITYEHGNCGWFIENVDASDHKNNLVQEEFNQVIKGTVLGTGCAFDAVAVGSYAHRFRRFWTNLISTTLLHNMVEQQFASRSSEQSVQDILEPGRRVQLAQHDRAPRVSLYKHSG